MQQLHEIAKTFVIIKQLMVWWKWIIWAVVFLVLQRENSFLKAHVCLSVSVCLFAWLPDCVCVCRQNNFMAVICVYVYVEFGI